MSIRARGVDFHCHVDLFPNPVAKVAACERERIITLAVTTTPMAWAQNYQWTAGSRYVFAAIGLHPELVGERQGEIDSLERLMTETAFIGEIGLDGSPRHRISWQIQKEIFIRTLTTAQRLGGRVASIHSRMAAREVLECLAKYTTPQRVLPILHWYSDSTALARQADQQGCYFSINPRMLNNRSGLALVRTLPQDKILTESDAPFANKFTGESDQQHAMTAIRQLANVRGTTADEMSEIVLRNAERVLGFAGVSFTYC